MTQVYAIRVCDGIVKIGIAKNPLTRLDFLQMFIRRERPDISLTLLRVENVESSWHARDVERAAHKDLAAKRLPYEWFAENGVFDTTALGPTEWFEVADIEAICAVKASIIQPLPVPLPRCRPAPRFENLFTGTLTEYLTKKELFG